jgi:hypothetical protein
VHGGSTPLGNLALACFTCNRRKNQNLSSVDPITGQVVPLYNPRRQRWTRHFRLEPSGMITPLTPTGRTTVRFLQLNLPVRVSARGRLLARGMFPFPAFADATP